MKRALPLIGALLVAGGLFLLGWLAWVILSPGPAPYRYELVAEGGMDKFPDLGLNGQEDLAIRKYEVRAAGADTPVAVLHVGNKENGAPVLLEWQNRAAEPVLTITAQMSELVNLAQAVSKHTPPRSVVLAWWDTSRQLELLAGANVLLDENLAQPLLIPAPWHGERDAIEALEQRFWKVPRSSETEAQFNQYVDALLSDVRTGVAKLRQLAGGGEAYVVVHLSEAYRLGALHPDRFGIAYRDFPKTGQTHGMITGVKGWLDKQGYESYALEDKGGNAVRVYFFTAPTSGDTLMAQMLPFSTSRPLELEELQLVYQHRGYWLYKLPTADQKSTQGTEPRMPLKPKGDQKKR